jgi:hypothetical protein
MGRLPSLAPINASVSRLSALGKDDERRMTALFQDWLSGKARRATAIPLAPDIMAQDS